MWRHDMKRLVKYFALYKLARRLFGRGRRA